MRLGLKTIFCAALITASLFSACQKKQMAFTPAQERIADLYVQLSRLQETIPAHSPAYKDSAGKIIALSGLTEKEYRETITYFCEEPERWEAFYKEVLKRLNVGETHTQSSQ
jgi:hypothetical protein